MKLKLGTRGSALAISQSEQVADALRARGHEVKLVRIRTGGDVARGSLTQLGGVGVFAAELRIALLNGECDFAVHSLKDLPTQPVEGLTIAAVPARVDHRDALCARDGRTLTQLPTGATVGTGSPRRVAQLRQLRPDLRYVDVRGNVGTRLARVSAADLDAVVLAAAGLERLGMTEHITDYLELLPSPGQGALALECRTDNTEVMAALAALDHPETARAVHAERQMLAELGGGCAAPIGALGRGGTLEAGVFALDGSAAVTHSMPLADDAGALAAQQLLRQGAADIAELDASRPSRLAELHDDSSLWRGANVLAGMHVFFPRADEGDLLAALRASGAEVTAEPVQRRVPLATDRTFEGADWIAVTSPATFTVLEQLGLRFPESARLAVVGLGTATAAREHGYRVDLLPVGGESSAASLAEAWPVGSGRVLIPGSALSSPVLAAGLREKGYEVETLPVYTMEPVESLPQRLVTDYRSGHFDAVVVLSGSMGTAIEQLLGWPSETAVVAFGPPSAASLHHRSVPVAAQAATQDADGLIQALATIRKHSA